MPIFSIEQVSLLMVGLTIMLVIAQALTGAVQLGFLYGLGSRDEVKERSVFLRRIDRTVANHNQALLLFLLLAAVALGLSIESALLSMGATVFLIARVLFILLYFMGIPYLRTLSWAAGIVGLIMMLAAILPSAFA